MRTDAMERLRLVTLSAALFLLLNGASDAYAGADGTFKVVGVKPDNVLNMRSGPSADYAVTGTIPANSEGLRNLGCQDGSSFERPSAAAEAEKRTIRFRRWCKVEYRGSAGWVAGWHLEQGRLAAAAPGGVLTGEKWWLLRVQDDPAQGDAWLSVSEDGAVSGDAGCNRFTGSARLGAGTIAFGPLVSTKMACPSDMLSTQQMIVMAILTDELSYRMENENLVIWQPSDGESLTFYRKAAQ